MFIFSECGKLCSLYSLDDVNRGISGIALTLCSGITLFLNATFVFDIYSFRAITLIIDRIDEVRDEAAKLTARILGMMVQNEIGNENKVSAMAF